MEKINFNENRNLSEIFISSLQFIKSEGSSLFKFYIRFLFPLLIPLAIFTYQSDLIEITEIINKDISELESAISNIDINKLWMVGLSQAFVWLVFLTITLIYIRNYCSDNSQPLSNKEMWNQMLYEFPKIFIVQFFYVFMVFFGTLSFVIPGIYFAITFALATTILVFNDTRIFQAFSLSLRLTFKKWFKVLGYLLIIYLIYFVARIILQFPFSLILTRLSDAGDLSRLSFTILNIFNSIINLFSSLFLVLGTVFLYYILDQHTEPILKQRTK